MAIFEGREAILEVARHVDIVDESTSSHWRIETAGDRIHPLKQNPFELAYGDEGFRSIGPIGSVSTKAGFPYETVHRLLQAPIRWQGRNFGQFRAIERAARPIV